MAQCALCSLRPLYTVAGDEGAHDGTGANGAEGLWFAITPTGEKAAP
jgi:hypothetical protein